MLAEAELEQFGGEVGGFGRKEYGLPSINAVHFPFDWLWPSLDEVPMPFDLADFVYKILGGAYYSGTTELFPWHLHKWRDLYGAEYYVGKGASPNPHCLLRDMYSSLILFPVEFIDTNT